MKKYLVIAASLIATLAYARFGGRTWTENQILTRLAPTLVTEGMDLNEVLGYRVTVCAPAGATITGGAVKCYLRPIATAEWQACEADMSFTPDTGSQCYSTPDILVTVGFGRVLYGTNSLTTSAGTTAQLSLEARVSQ